MPNDARNKLRSMGGIMASSPELMQAAQGYQAGGPVMSTPPTVPQVSGYAPGLLPTGTIDPRLGYSGRTAPISPTQARRNRALELGVESLRMDGPMTFGGGAQYRPTTPDMPFEPRVPRGPEAGQPERMDARAMRGVLAGEGSMGDGAGVTVDDLLDGSGAEGFSVPETRAPKTEAQQRAERIDALRRDSVEAAAEFVRGLPNPAEALSDYANIFGAEAAGVVSSAVGATETGAEFFETAEAMRAGRERRQGSATTQEREPGTTPAPPRPVYDNPVFMENLLPPGAEEPSRAEKIKKRAEEELSKDAETTAPQPDTGEGDAAEERSVFTIAGRRSAGEVGAPTKKDLRSRYKEKIELFKEIYGEDDEDRARDKAMSLAMLGLAIASGQSPDALTNIAQGAMAGVQGMSEQEQARREREQGLRTLALETAIGEMDAEREAQARAAESRLDFERDVILEGIKARGGGGKNAYENVPRIAEQAVNFENQLRERAAEGGLTIPEGVNQDAFIMNERNKRMIKYIDTLGKEGVILDPKTRASLGQQYMYREVDPNDPEAGSLPLVRSDRELTFILPGQSYLEVDPETGKYTRETKPADE